MGGAVGDAMNGGGCFAVGNDWAVLPANLAFMDVIASGLAGRFGSFSFVYTYVVGTTYKWTSCGRNGCSLGAVIERNGVARDWSDDCACRASGRLGQRSTALIIADIEESSTVDLDTICSINWNCSDRRGGCRCTSAEVILDCSYFYGLQNRASWAGGWPDSDDAALNTDIVDVAGTERLYASRGFSC